MTVIPETNNTHGILSGWVRILIKGGYYFISAKAIVWILFEGGHYSMCKYYLSKCGNCRSHLRGEPDPSESQCLAEIGFTRSK